MTHPPSQQLPLSLFLDNTATFENFYAPPGSIHKQIIIHLRAQLTDNGEPYIFLWGKSGEGLTHLLQAASHYSEQKGLVAHYFSLKDVAACSPQALFENLEQADLICLDDFHAIAGQDHWEQAIFDLFNRLREKNKRLLIASTYSPRALSIELADLASRLHSGMVFQLHALNSDEKKAALQLRAQERGLTLNDTTAQFILSRAPRNMHDLISCLDRLDTASLTEQRKLTVPFVKEVLDL